MSPDVIKQLMAAMKQFKPLVKDKNNPFFKSKYADLPQVYDAVKGPLNDHGFILLQGTGHWPDGVAYIKTQLLHVSGEEFSSTYDLPPGLDAQKMAAAVTYGKRVALCALLALAADDDDDGEAAEGRNHRAAPRQEAPKPIPAPPKAPPPPPAPEPLIAVDPSTPEDKAKADSFLNDAQKIVTAAAPFNPDIPQDASVMLVQVVGFNPNPRPVGDKGSMTYSLKIMDIDGSGEEEWTSTFHKDAWETGKLLKGQMAHLTYKRKGKYLNFFHIQKAS
jgi:hypothetical protein